MADAGPAADSAATGTPGLGDAGSRGPLPLAGVRVVECTHMVMGPTCGMVLADLGAEVIKVEPPGGDSTRRLIGSGAGFFGMFNRNKRGLAVDMHDPRGREVVLRLVAHADVFSENFKTGAMDALGLGQQALATLNPRLVYVSHKGFLPGPYAERTALDEVVQMMGGLAYMTGPEGRPLRAGSSVNDIMGGLFGAIGVLAALRRRDHPSHPTGQGGEVHSALFENNVLLVAQHMMQFAVTGQAAAPMPSRISAWAVYDVFTVAGGDQIFLAAVSDRQWRLLCADFAWPDLADDLRLATNNDRVRARDWMMPLLRTRLAGFTAAELARRFEGLGLPYAPITRPQDLFDDPHLAATGGLAPLDIPPDASSAGRTVHTRAPLLPLSLDGQRLPVRQGPPALGQDSQALLRELGYRDAEIDALASAGVLVR
jgi:crotonobetainyl-CoA:carnitine CoA-transferase CaiB-like acyl-CoA transferase